MVARHLSHLGIGLVVLWVSFTRFVTSYEFVTLIACSKAWPEESGHDAAARLPQAGFHLFPPGHTNLRTESTTGFPTSNSARA